VLATALLVVLLAAAPAYAAGRKAAPGSTLATATPLSISTDVVSTATQMHTFHSAKAVMYVKFSAKKGVTYVLKVLGADKTRHGRWTKVTFFRNDRARKKWYQAEAEYSVDGAATTYVTVKALVSTTYAIRIRPYNAAGAGAAFGLRLISSAYPPVKPDAYEPKDNTLAGGTVLAPHVFDLTGWQNSGIYLYNLCGSAFQLHSISPAADHDWYSVTVPANEYCYTAFFMGDWTNHEVRVNVCDAQGSPLTKTPSTLDYEIGTLSLPVVTTPTTYWLDVSGNGSDTFWYRIGLLYYTP
jgi:hypothetical protein